MVGWLIAVVGLMVLGLQNSVAALSGTNAVTLLESNVENASTVSWTVAIGILAALVCLSVFMKVGRRAGIRA